MPYVIGSPCDYILTGAIKRLVRDRRILDVDGNPFRPTVALGAEIKDEFVAFGDKHDWREPLAWLNDLRGPSFSYSPFSSEWRRYFAFLDEADAVAFKLRFG